MTTLPGVYFEATYLAEASALAGSKRSRRAPDFYQDKPAPPPSELHTLTLELEARKVSSTSPWVDENDCKTLDFDDSNAGWDVESILDKRSCAGETEYLIKWAGFGTEQNTWEPINHLRGAIDELRRFEETIAAEKVRAAEARAAAAEAARGAAVEAAAVEKAAVEKATVEQAATAEARAAGAEARAAGAEARAAKAEMELEAWATWAEHALASVAFGSKVWHQATTHREPGRR